MFACFSSARYLAEAITETLGVALMLKLVFLKTLIALEVLIPIALYVSIIIGLGRMHRDQEIIAMRAAGINGLRIIKSRIVGGCTSGYCCWITGYGRATLGL